MTQLHQSKVFANGSTTLPKPVRDALGVKAGDSVRYVISGDGVLVSKMPSEKAKADLEKFQAPFSLSDGLRRTLQSEFMSADPDRAIFFTE